MKTLTSFLLLMVSLLALATAAQATTYYVDQNRVGASNSNACTTTASPCLTINGGVAKMASGDRLEIRSGTYTENLQCTTLCPPSGTSTSNQTTIAVFAGDTVVWKSASGGSIINAVANFAAPGTGNYIKITGQNATLEFDGTGMAGVGGLNNGDAGISSNANSTGWTFSYLKVHNVRTVQNCALGTAGPGILLGGSFHLIDHVESYDNGHDLCGGEQYSGYGLYNPGNNNTIQYSSFHGNGGYGVQSYHSGSSSDNNNVIRFNTIYHNSQKSTATTGGIVIGSGSNHKVYGNVVYDNFDGIEISYSCTDCVVYNNTVYNHRSRGINIGATTVRLLVTNNIVMNSGTVNGEPNIADDGSSSPTFTTNLCSGSGGSANCTFSVNPLFVDAANNNFQLQAGSQAIDTGTTLSAPYNTAIDLTPRPQGKAFDIGAYEASGVILPVVVINQPAGCAGTSIACQTSLSTITVSGTSDLAAGGIISWSCDRCTPSPGSTITGTINTWTLFPALTLKSGINILTVNATTLGGAVGTDTIAITYTPSYPGPTLAGAWSFDEPSGDALDSSGNGNTGTMNNGATRNANGRFGRALQLSSASSQSVIVADANSLDFTQSFTITAWVQPSVLHTDFRAILHKNSLPRGASYDLYASIQGAGYCATSAVLGLARTNGASGPNYNVCSVTPLPINTWTHVALVYDGNTLNLYRSDITPGTPVATTFINPRGYLEPSTGTLQIGGSEFAEYFDGLLDEVRLYNWALPVTAGGNTIGGACNQTASTATPSIAGDMNCPIVPLVAPVLLKFGAGAPFKMGAAAVMKWGTVPQ